MAMQPDHTPVSSPPRRRLDPAGMLDRSDRRLDPAAWSAVSPGGMVATAHYLATDVGATILSDGGNAVDAAVAASLALGVCEPAGSGLGGMTMMVVHLGQSRRTFTLEGPCVAPRLATPEALAATNRYRGRQAVAVPTNPAVLCHALRNYGTMPPKAVLAPAIRLAEEGHRLTALHCRLVRENQTAIVSNGAGPLFLQPNGEAPQPGALFRQPALARTLCRLADAGFEDFYTGEIARRLCDDLRAGGGFVREDDLAAIPWPRESKPISARIGDLDIRALGPPGGGLVLIQMVRMLHFVEKRAFDPDTPQGAVLLAEIIRRARRDRKRFRLKVGADSPRDAAVLLSEEHAGAAVDELLSGLGLAHGPDETRSPAPGHGSVAGAGEQRRGPLDPRGETSHVSVMDRWGNVVSMTQSIERSFGAAAASPELGFLYNGFLRAFKIKNLRHPHYLRPGAVARSNAAPSIVFRGGVPWAAVGSSGSERLASSIFQVLVRLRRQAPFEAVAAPRLHCTPQRLLLIEADRFPPACLDALLDRGFLIEVLEPFAFKVGGLQLVVREGEAFRGVADPRRDGAAAGPE